MGSDLTPTLGVERLLPIDPQLKKKQSKADKKKGNTENEEAMAKYHRQYDKALNCTTK